MKQTIRFFIYDPDQDFELVETTELEFIKAEGEIQYERHTMFENGVNQVCLTRYPF